MSEKEKNEFGNQTFKRNFSKKEDINKIKSGMKRFRRKNTNRRHLDEKNEVRYIPRVNDRNRHIDKEVDGKEEKMYVIPLGGIEEVGKNMTAFQYKDEIIVVDAGLTFPEDEHLGIDVIIPDFSYLESNRHKIKGLLLTHGHEDHIGAIPYFYQKLGTENIPMYGGRLTLALAKAKFEKKDAKLPKEKVISGRTILKVSKYFTVEFISVTHSIADCYAICIKTPAATILHSGDFKVDLTPVDGEGFDFGRLAQLGEEGVDLLLSDSTNYDIISPSELILAKVASMACKAAIKGNMRISLLEANELFDELLSLDNPYNCPHGRPTVIKIFSKNPTFISVLSGKINTIYDLDEVLANG